MEVVESLPVLAQRSFSRGSGVLWADIEKKGIILLLLIVLFEGFKPRSSKDSLASTNPSPSSARVKLTTLDKDAHIALELIRESSRFLRHI
jgi:hypothetical protein